jgi:hypothetical protein
MMKKIPMLTTLFAGSLLLALTACDYVDEDSYGSGAGDSDVNLVINEIMSNGDVADWYEIYNPGEAALDLEGFGTWDLGMAGDPYHFPAGTSIDAHGYLVIVCNDASTGVETNFKLSSGGESVFLSDAAGALIDEVVFPALESNTSWARLPDGVGGFQVMETSTPGAANDGDAPNQAPTIGSVTRSPQSPTPADVVTVSAEVTDDSALAAVLLMVAFNGADAEPFTMSATGDLYSTQIPVQEEGSSVSYWIVAEDDEGLSALNPEAGSTYSYVSTTENYSSTLILNEFLASNDACCADELGDFDDWIEIYNFGSAPVDLGGMYITDDLLEPTMWQIPLGVPDSTTVEAGGFIVFWADKEPEQGILHLDLKLGGSGEQVGLYAPDAFNNVAIDTLSYTEQSADISWARLPDGGETWDFDETPTPGASNGD